jgi:acyl-ACP thioesterase
VHVDLQTMRPATLAEDFLVTAREAAMERKVSARSMLRIKPEGAEQRDAWPVRFSDMDALGHMNNAAYWEAIEEWLSGHRDFREPFAVVLEHLTPIEPGHDVFTVTREEKNLTAIWHEMNGVIAAVTQLQKL